MCCAERAPCRRALDKILMACLNRRLVVRYTVRTALWLNHGLRCASNLTLHWLIKGERRAHPVE